MEQVKWMQDQKNLYIQYYIGKVQKSQIELTIYENFFQVYNKIKKSLNRIDFYDKVLIEEFTAFSFDNGWIKFQVQKQKFGLWEKYEVDQDKDTIKKKRKDAIQHRDDFLQNLNKIKKEQKHKEIQQAQEKKFQQEDEYQQQKNEEKQKQKQKAFNNIENITQNINSQKILLEKDKNKFLQKVQDDQQYEIRGTNQITLEFTPKVYNNLAMREQYIFQPPQIKDTKNGGNFMWLHDKGNEFLKKKDYESAMNAYKEALKIEPNYLHTIANISLIHLKLTEFSLSYQQCEKFENVYNNSDENSQNLKQNKLMYQQIKKRKIFILLNEGKIEQANQIILNMKTIDDENIKSDIQKIQQRIDINKQKQQADKLMQKKQFKKAQILYEKMLKNDLQNEKILSNLSLIEMKNQNFKQALQYINQVLGKLSIYGQQFEIKNKNESIIKEFIEKLLMRKINCEEQLQMFEHMKDSIQFLLKINLENTYAIQKRKYLQIIENKKLYLEKKKEFKLLVTQKKLTQALNIFNQMEQLITLEHDTLEYLTLSLNKSVIFSYQKKFSQVIAECSKGLRTISNLRKNTLNKKRKIFYQNNEQNIKNIEIKYLFKRANAYLQTKQFIGGKQDLECVLQYDPMNKLAHDSLKKVQEVCQLNY